VNLVQNSEITEKHFENFDLRLPQVAKKLEKPKKTETKMLFLNNQNDKINFEYCDMRLPQKSKAT